MGQHGFIQNQVSRFGTLRLVWLAAVLLSALSPEVAFPKDDMSCPQGSILTGGTPPAAKEWGCQKIKPDGQAIRHGWWTEWYLNGQKKQEGEYREGERIGHWVWWYPNGLKMQEGNYLFGLPTGSWSFWASNGAPIDPASASGAPAIPKPATSRVEFRDLARNMRREFR